MSIDRIESPPEAEVEKWDFWDWCLAGLSVFTLAMGLLIFFLYALPQEPLLVPEVQASIRVGRLDDFPLNTSRLQSWGSELILVIRTDDGEMRAVEGRSPTTNCVLQWDSRRGHIHSPCSYEIYNPLGYIVSGLGDQALQRYPVWIRDGIISIGSES
jgi:hypothetical protein